jgi:hypothetical protein
VTCTVKVAVDRLLVASTFNSRLPVEYSAFCTETVSAVGAEGDTESVAVRVTPPLDAVIVTLVAAVTDCVVTVKVALPAPAATVTLAGTFATAVLLLERDTTLPPVGAAPVSVTVPCDELPLVTLAGLRASDERVTAAAVGETVSVAVLVTPNDAEIVTGVDAGTEAVVTVKVALVAPAATVTLAGTLATAVLLLESETSAPPDGAAPVRVTVPCEEVPPVTVVGFNDTVDSVEVGAGPDLTLTLLVEDHAPGAPAELFARTRHHSVDTGKLLPVN